MNAAAPSPDFHDDPEVQQMLRVRDGDMQALEELVNVYYPLLQAELVRQSFTEDDALDISQIVLIKVYRERESYTPKSTFKTWIFSQLHYEMRRWKEDQKGRAGRGSVDYQNAEPGTASTGRSGQAEILKKCREGD